MNLIKFLPHALIIGVLAGFVQWLDANSTVGGLKLLPSWVVFQTWSLYFLAGCNLKGGAKVSSCYALGIFASWGIVLLVGQFVALGDFAAPMAVCLVASAVIFMEKIKALDMIPAYFIASGGSFFALHGAAGLPVVDAVKVSFCCLALGQTMGILSVFLKGKYQAMLDAKNPQVQAEEQKKAA